MVKKFDQNGVVIDTGSPEDEPEVQDDQSSDKVLDRTAMAATNRDRPEQMA